VYLEYWQLLEYVLQRYIIVSPKTTSVTIHSLYKTLGVSPRQSLEILLSHQSPIPSVWMWIQQPKNQPSNPFSPYHFILGAPLPSS
jgi:hypothetical protein